MLSASSVVKKVASARAPLVANFGLPSASAACQGSDRESEASRLLLGFSSAL